MPLISMEGWVFCLLQESWIQLNLKDKLSKEFTYPATYWLHSKIVNYQWKCANRCWKASVENDVEEIPMQSGKVGPDNL